MSLSNGQKVLEFHQVLAAAYALTPQMPDEALLRFRQKLINEECQEVADALENCLEQGEAGIPALAHELADLLYVTYGAFWALGVDPDPVFTAVHEANMRKVSGPRRADGKILKPAGWEPADVTAVINQLKDQDSPSIS